MKPKRNSGGSEKKALQRIGKGGAVSGGKAQGKGDAEPEQESPMSQGVFVVKGTRLIEDDPKKAREQRRKESVHSAGREKETLKMKVWELQSLVRGGDGWCHRRKRHFDRGLRPRLVGSKRPCPKAAAAEREKEPPKTPGGRSVGTHETGKSVTKSYTKRLHETRDKVGHGGRDT